MDIEHLTLDELKQGYRYEVKQFYQCLTCGETYTIGEVFTFDGRFFEAKRAVELHVEKFHGSAFVNLLHSKSKYNTLTDKQKQFLELSGLGLSDKSIAERLGISTSTVRHQRYMFREKAKQAKMFLAIYEQISDQKNQEEEPIIAVESNLEHIDERFIITEKENEQILSSYFSSLSPLKLHQFPIKEKKKIAILTRIAKEFKHDRTYTEKEINSILQEVYDDFVTLRRYLVDYRYIARTNDGKSYWLITKEES